MYSSIEVICFPYNITNAYKLALMPFPPTHLIKNVSKSARKCHNIFVINFNAFRYVVKEISHSLSYNIKCY